MIKLTRDMVVIDLETTSNKADSARIVSISAIRITPEGKMDKLYLVLNPEAPIDPKASETHGFYEDDVKDCPTFKQKAVAIHNHISGCGVYVTYNGNRFDLPILSRQLSEAGLSLPLEDIDIIDVFGLVTRLNPRTLTAMVKQYLGEDLEGAHDASVDTMATVRLLYKMAQVHPEIPEDTKDIALFANNDKPLLDLAGKFSYNEDGKIIFVGGKHNEEVVDLSKHRSYMEWMQRADKPPFNPDTLVIVNKFLNNQISN